jgi:hypothetical protein
MAAVAPVGSAPPLFVHRARPALVIDCKLAAAVIRIAIKRRRHPRHGPSPPEKARIAEDWPEKAGAVYWSRRIAPNASLRIVRGGSRTAVHARRDAGSVLAARPCVRKERAAVAHEIGPRMGDCAGQARAAATIALRHDHAIPHKCGRGAAKAQRTVLHLDGHRKGLRLNDPRLVDDLWRH